MPLDVSLTPPPTLWQKYKKKYTKQGELTITILFAFCIGNFYLLQFLWIIYNISFLIASSSIISLCLINAPLLMRG